MDKLRMYQSMDDDAREEAMRTDPDMFKIHFKNLRCKPDNGNLRREVRKCKLFSMLKETPHDSYLSCLKRWFGRPVELDDDAFFWPFDSPNECLPSGEVALIFDGSLRLLKRYPSGWVKHEFSTTEK